MKKAFICIVLLCNASLPGMMLLVKRVMPRVAPVRMQHTSFRPCDYGINSHNPSASLENIPTTVRNIKKFLKDQPEPQKYAYEDIKNVQDIHQILIEQAQTAESIHHAMNGALDKHNKSFVTLTKRGVFFV